MRLNDFLGVFTTLSFIIPVAMVLFLGLYVNKSLISLAVYCFFTGICLSMATGLLEVAKTIRINAAVLINYLDAPLMMGVMGLYCSTAFKKNLLFVVAFLDIIYEIVIAILFGLQPASSVYASGVGLLVVFTLGVYFFINQLKQTIRFNKGMGRTLIAAAIFFGYGLYSIIFYLHYIYKAPQASDVFLLYYLTSIIFCALVSAGLFHLYRQHREIRQLRVVRRELEAFFQPEQ